MKLSENGEQFTEKIKVDIPGNTEQIHVPKHQDRMEVDILNDFNIVRYNLSLVFQCFIYLWIDIR